MRHYRAADHRRSRWKNGKGETYEVAVHPPAATLDSFEWRISIALLEADAEFSEFPGIDRTLTIIEGDGIALVVDGIEHRLDTSAAPLRFAGDRPARAALLGGRSVDLNVMTRRTAADHQVSRIRAGDATNVGPGMVAIFALADLHLLANDAPILLAKWDLLGLSPGETASIVQGDGLLVSVVPSVWR